MFRPHLLLNLPQRLHRILHLTTINRGPYDRRFLRPLLPSQSKINRFGVLNVQADQIIQSLGIQIRKPKFRNIFVLKLGPHLGGEYISLGGRGCVLGDGIDHSSGEGVYGVHADDVITRSHRPVRLISALLADMFFISLYVDKVGCFVFASPFLIDFIVIWSEVFIHDIVHGISLCNLFS